MMDMDERPLTRELAFRTQQRNECMERRLVLEAAGIPAEAFFHDGWWQLVVHERDLARASAELEAYQQENSSTKPVAKVFPTYGGAKVAVLGFVAVAVLVDVLAARRAFGFDWHAVGAMEAGKVMSGQWWRCVTALTLHVDPGHLIANLVFGTVFGLIAGRILGGGVAWFALVLAGTLGNFINAMVRSAEHSSVGASTAVFAALGMIVFHALRSGGSDRVTLMKKWSPLIGGLVLFAFTGIGSERTDVVAHATGFLAGMLLGSIGCQLPQKWLASKQIQMLSGFATVALIATAWIIGLREAA